MDDDLFFALDEQIKSQSDLFSVLFWNSIHLFLISDSLNYLYPLTALLYPLNTRL